MRDLPVQSSPLGHPLCVNGQIPRRAGKRRGQAGVRESETDPLGRAPPLRFGRMTRHPQSRWFKPTSIYVALTCRSAIWAGLGLSSGWSSWSRGDPSCACGQLWSAGGGSHSSAMRMPHFLRADSVWSQNQAPLGRGFNKGLWPTLK